MKKILPLLTLLALITCVGCEENKKSPEGPSDIRIYNQTAKDFENIVVHTGEDRTHTYGSLASGEYTAYHRFERAYPKGLITLTIDGEEYATEEPDYTYAVYLGQGKFSYKVFILDEDDHLLDNSVVAEAPLDD